MTLTLSSDHLQAIKTHAESTYPEECCGLLLGNVVAGNKLVLDFRITENAWNHQVADELDDPVADELPRTKTHRYWIAPEEMLVGMRAARHQDLEIIGIYHSHTDHPAVPSECDRRLAWSQYSYLIVSVIQGQAADAQSWTLDDRHQFQPEPIQMQEFPRMRRESLTTHS